MELYERAAWMRDHPTPSELQAWMLLRKLQPTYIFKRQRVLYGTYYIGDFFCERLNLVIEIDGPSHNSFEAQKKDERRKNMLNRWGYTVMPFSDEVVFQNPEHMFKEVKRICDIFEEKYYGSKKESIVLTCLNESQIKRTNRLKREGRQNLRTQLF